MGITTQLIIVFLLIIAAIFYFINRGRNDKSNTNCNDKCSQCDLFNHCKVKK